MGRRIVIVADDDGELVDCFETVLTDEGYEVLTAPNGRAVLELLDKIGDDRCVLMLDLMMPLVSGHQVLEVLAHAGRLAVLGVIVCTASIDRDALPPGARYVLEKPIRLDDLLPMLEDLCGPQETVSGIRDLGVARRVDAS